MSEGPAKRRAMVLLGSTGAGKTPLGNLIEERGLWNHRWVHFDFGAQLRRIAAGDCPEGRFGRDDIALVQRVLREGTLLEDEHAPLAEQVLRTFLAERASPETGVVLNGLPRHVGQIKTIEPLVDVCTVLALRCPSETAIQRIRSNVAGDRTGRNDDSEEMVRAKIELFYERTNPLIAHYLELDIPVRRIVVTATMTPDEVWRILERRGG